MNLTEEPRKIRVGSVKDIYDYGNNSSNLLFVYSDRYSIFDWGEMPDLIPHKGKALTTMADLFFKKLEKEKILHHSLHSIGNAEGKTGIKVKKISIKENFQYQNEKPTEALVPLEVVFRFGVPLGSSLPERQKGIEIGDLFDDPLIEFSTKLESQDRYLSEKEAQQMAGLSDLELKKIKLKTKEVALILKKIFMTEMGITLWDGKLEWAFSTHPEFPKEKERDFILVDSIGPDELRLTYKELLLSKEFLRQFYRGSVWKNALDQAKKENPQNWKNELMAQNILPIPLDQKILSFASLIYTTLANALSLSEGLEPPFPGPTQIPQLHELYRQEFRHKYYQ